MFKNTLKYFSVKGINSKLVITLTGQMVEEISHA